MKVINIFFSPTGGTKKVSDIIAAGLSQETEIVDLSKQTDIKQISKEDIAVISMPSFGGRVPAVAAERLKQIKADGTKAVLVCVYGNRAYDDTLIEMQDIAESCGFKVTAAVSAVAEHSIVRKYGACRPDKQDKTELESFAQKIKEKITNADETVPNIPGNRPYLKAGKGGIVPKTSKDCINCKKCALNCPVSAISEDNVKQIDKTKCISCMRCVSICPKSAKKSNKLLLFIVSLVLKKVCSSRKQNELFI